MKGLSHLDKYMRQEEQQPPTTLPYYLAERIQHEIITGEFEPGRSLREQELGTQFGSSRGPIREGLRLLELRGLVEHTPRRGFRVRTYTEADIESLYRLRSLLEGAVIDALARLDVSALVADLDRINRQMYAASSAGDLESYFEHNIEFHQRMIDFAQDLPLARVLSIVNDMSMPLRYLLHRDRFPESNDFDYHSNIVWLLAQGRFEQAKRETAQHIGGNMPQIIERYYQLTGARR